MPTKEEIAWAAGIFEGEGCFSHNLNGNRNTKRLPTASVQMTDRDVIEKFCAVVEIGHFNAQHSPSQNKPVYTWRTNTYEGVKYVYDLLSPWLCARRLAKGKEELDAYLNQEIPEGYVRKAHADSKTRQLFGANKRFRELTYAERKQVQFANISV